ncbi:hypothetical protein [Gordonia mangrovi]|uniref:hypothetical protein n=1 Tax=Gordonia mangrovi TaxID=2665643 RepID=UPI0021ACC782|nr:hypothetical protein [Gordonia mangrovi]UVF78667.1 hypothetical protein NWF22_01980 [Gordonia mangrovi]
MQGYGCLRRHSLRRSASLVLGAFFCASATACAISTDTAPSEIVLPPTDVLSTQTETSASTNIDSSLEDTADPPLPNWTIGRLIALAPRVDNAKYHQGSQTPDSTLEDTSGFHFSPPDRGVNCSTATADITTLACRVNADISMSTSPDAPGGCDGKNNLVTLSAEGTDQGVCADHYPVLYRSTIVDYGHTISISRFSCLVETAGMFCLESRSDDGFAITPTGLQEIEASDRAPAELLGIPASRTESSSDGLDDNAGSAQTSTMTPDTVPTS